MATEKTLRKKKTPVAGTTRKVAPEAVSDETLKRTPERIVTFLVGVGNIPEVRAALAARGYDASVHAAGWLLLDRVGGRDSLLPPPPAPTDEAAAKQGAAVEAAQGEVESWTATNFAVANVALKRTFPTQHAYVFAEGLKAGQGGAAVLAAQTFLTRVGHLGTKRRTPDPDDAKALAHLEARGITEAERKRVQALVAVVQEGKTPVAAVAPTTRSPSSREAQVALYGWYSEWAGIAHAVVKRRDHLVRLGLATLRRKKKPAAIA